MPKNRIYLGVDTHSNLAVSLESDGKGQYFIIVSTSTNGEDLCRFECTEEDLERIVEKPVQELKGLRGHCSIHSSGDAIIFEYRGAENEQPSTCALSANSFSRVLKLAKNRAFLV